MEDWERHFLEKSRRRAAKEAGRRRRTLIKAGLAAAVALIAIGTMSFAGLF